MPLDILLKHGLSKHHVQVDGGMALSNLAAEVEKVTGVPKENQKLILRGKTITAVDHSKTLQECGITNDCKIMVLGRKLDPEADEVYRKIVELENKAQDITDKKMSNLETELRGMEHGVEGNEKQKKALQGLKKRCEDGFEEYMCILEALDCFSLEGRQEFVYAKRKSVATMVNDRMDHYEGVLDEITKLLKKLD